jgi:hypothetical protein
MARLTRSALLELLDSNGVYYQHDWTPGCTGHPHRHAYSDIDGNLLFVALITPYTYRETIELGESIKPLLRYWLK